MSYFTFTPICGTVGAAAPQATFTPVDCRITLATLCTPVCGQAAAPQAATAPQTVTPPTSIGCGTLATICNPTFMHCTTRVAAAPQAAAPQNLNMTWTPLCPPTSTPVCPQTWWPGCAQQGAGAPAAASPQGLTVFTLCTPVCNTVTPVQC